MANSNQCYSKLINQLIFSLIIFFLSYITFNTAYAIDKRSFPTWQNKPKDVLGVGQAMYDVFYKISDEKKFQKYLKEINLTKGSCTEIPTKLMQKISKDLKVVDKIPGGGVSNTLSGIATFGSKVDFLAVVGDDKLGHSYKNSLKKYFIGDLIQVAKLGTTGTVAVILAPDGERTMVVSPADSRNLSASVINKPLIEKYKIVFSEVYLLDNDSNKHTYFFELFNLAKKCKAITILSLSTYNKVIQHYKTITKLLPLTDIVFADRKEIAALAQTSSWLKTKQNLKKYNSIFVVTDGKNGSHILHKGKEIHIPADKIDSIIDTTGAGDQFAAGFIYGYLNKLSLKECGKLATKSACRIIGQMGAKPNIPFNELLKTEIATTVLRK